MSAGEAAHITAAQENGPRYDSSLTPEQRRHADNGIWLCVNCATVVDKDWNRYSADTLRDWKFEAEDRALKRLGKADSCSTGRLVNVSPAIRLGAETAVLVDGHPVPYALVIDPDAEGERPTWFVNGFVVQFSIQKRHERANAIVENFVATVHEVESIPSYVPLMMVYPAEVSLYYVEIDWNQGTIPREFIPTRYYETGGTEDIRNQIPPPIVLDDSLPAHVAIRINAKKSGMYLVSVDASVLSGDDRELVPVVTPQRIIFETNEDAEASQSL